MIYFSNHGIGSFVVAEKRDYRCNQTTKIFLKLFPSFYILLDIFKKLMMCTTQFIDDQASIFIHNAY